KTLVTGGGDGTLRFWDTTCGKERDVRKMENHHPIAALAFSPDGKALAAGSRAGPLWVGEAGGQGWLTLGGPVREALAVAFTPDSKTLASLGADKAVRLWKVSSAKEQASFPVPFKNPMALALSPDGRTMAVGGSDKEIEPGELRLWDRETGKETVSLKGHQMQVKCLAFSLDGKTL